MITYPDGNKYGSHCFKQPRKSSVMVTCDPDATKGTFRLVEEFRDANDSIKVDCYYLFELNNKAACTVKPADNSLSPGSILLIVFLIVGGVYLVLGFLYQRFVAGAKGLEQIPNYQMWTTFGGLQADGCNFICRCKKTKRTPTYKPVEDALADDLSPEADDDTLLPAV
ncbi:Cation-dependent mannose-6-phosphate receptor [Exaiptasia diaphana]|nr:Cation-dependent mannose-6-phosphate receptor [Exaiptasia diaphana]